MADKTFRALRGKDDARYQTTDPVTGRQVVLIANDEGFVKIADEVEDRIGRTVFRLNAAPAKSLTPKKEA